MKVLLIRLRSIGDIVQCTPAFEAARKLFPGAAIDLMVDRRFSDLVVENRFIDGLLLYGGGGGSFLEKLRYDLGFLMMLRKRRYDLVIDFHGVPKTAWMAYLSGAATRVGYAYPGRGRLYTHRLEPPKKFTVHSAVNQINLLRAVPRELAGGRIEEEKPIRTHVSAEFARPECVEFLTGSGISEGDTVVVYHISPSNDFKKWPAANYSALINLAERHPFFAGKSLTHVVTGTASDAEEFASIERSVSLVRGRLVSACGRLSLGALANLTARAACYVGPDSGPLHVAAAAGSCPVIGLFGPTNVETFAPPSPEFRGVFDERLPCRPCDQKRCLPGDFRCIRRIPVTEVLYAMLGAMSAAAKN